MESDSFRSRVVTLMQKSRRALRLYSSAAASGTGLQGELSQTQVQEWREINSDLLKKLSHAAESPDKKILVFEVYGIRSDFLNIWRASEAEVATCQRELIAAAEQGDFIRTAVLSADLVKSRARLQAGQAAYHEVDTLIRRSRLSEPVPLGHEPGAIELSAEAEVPRGREMKAAVGAGNVIPLRRRGS